MTLRSGFDKYVLCSSVHVALLGCVLLGVSLSLAAASDFGMSHVQGLQFGTVEGAQGDDLKTVLVQ